MIARNNAPPVAQLTRTESELKKLNEKMDKMLIVLGRIHAELAAGNRPKN